MKRITDISQLKSGDKIWRVKNDIDIEIIEFLCIHPYNNAYSIFIDRNKDGMPKFFNGRLHDAEYYIFDKKSKKDIENKRIEVLEKRLKNLKLKYDIK